MLISSTDIGSNTIHQIIVRIEGDTIAILARHPEILRFGEDTNTFGGIGAEKLEQACVVLRSMKATCEQFHCDANIIVATEGVRAAQNADDALKLLSEAAETPIVLISGDTEATLSFIGATADFSEGEQPISVVDLGGGSCEIVDGAGEAIHWKKSIHLGSGYLLDITQPKDPFTAADIMHMQQITQDILAAEMFPAHTGKIIGCGGSAGAIARFNPERIFRKIITLQDLEEILTLAQTQSAHTLQEITHISEKYIRIAVSGAAAWSQIIAARGADRFYATQFGVREGAALLYSHYGEAWTNIIAKAAQ